jgi:hypothetical protein
MAGDFPPNSRMQGTKFSAAAFATNFPFSVPPVKMIKSNFCLVIALATSIPPINIDHYIVLPSIAW